MDLNKKNMKNWMLLIVFAVLVYGVVQRIEILAAGFAFLYSIIMPFVLGAAMAFILNIPMHFLEKRLFRKAKKRKFVRPVCLVLSIFFVVAVIQIVLLVVLPEVATTFASISKNIEAFLPHVQEWAMNTFPDSEQMAAWIQSLEFNWDKIIQTAVDFLRNGASNVLSSTFTVARTVINSLMNFCVAFVFACYILLQKEKLFVQVKKVLYAFLPQKAVKKTLEVASLSYKTFSNFVTGQCTEAVILGTMFFVTMSILRFPYAGRMHRPGPVPAFTACRLGGHLSGRPEGVSYGPHHAGRVCSGNLFDFGIQPHAGHWICYFILGFTAGGGKPDLSSCSRRLCWASFYLGAGGSNCRWKSHGSCGNADFYSIVFCDLCVV